MNEIHITVTVPERNIVNKLMLDSQMSTGTIETLVRALTDPLEKSIISVNQNGNHLEVESVCELGKDTSFKVIQSSGDLDWVIDALEVFGVLVQDKDCKGTISQLDVFVKDKDDFSKKFLTGSEFVSLYQIKKGYLSSMRMLDFNKIDSLVIAGDDYYISLTRENGSFEIKATAEQMYYIKRELYMWFFWKGLIDSLKEYISNEEYETFMAELKESIAYSG